MVPLVPMCLNISYESVQQYFYFLPLEVTLAIFTVCWVTEHSDFRPNTCFADP